MAILSEATWCSFTTGIDFVKAVIDISLGEEPDLALGDHAAAGVRFVFDQKDVDILEKLKKNILNI